MQYPSLPGPLQAQTLLANTWVEAVEKKDRYTGGHVKRTAHYALKIARQIPVLSGETLARIRLAAILHDVGKLGIDDSILRKGAPLEPLEWGSMREHPKLGFEMIGPMSGLDPEVVDGIRSHHERWDGQGYPDRLAGEKIPWIARLIAVADSYDAMVSTRPYRKGMEPRLAYAEIVRQSGVQFDPMIVAAFERAFGATSPDSPSPDTGPRL